MNGSQSNCFVAHACILLFFSICSEENILLYSNLELELVKVITQGFLFCLYKCIQPCGRAYVSPNLHDVIKEMWKSVFHNNVFEVFTASVVACTSHQCRVAPLFSVQCSSGITHYRGKGYPLSSRLFIQYQRQDLYKKKRTEGKNQLCKLYVADTSKNMDRNAANVV